MKLRNVTAWDIIWVVIFALFIMVVFAIAISTVDAAEACRTHYVVRPRDTLRIIADKYDTEPWYLVRANRLQAERPNFPIYAWSSLCIPYPTDETKKIADTILDQPPAQMLITQKGKELTIRAYGFANGSNWFIREGGDKLGKMKIIKKVLTTRTLKTDAGLLAVCLKNQMTDFLYCGKVKQIR